MSSVLITGTARGIGRATALELARRGHRVIATSRDPGPLAELPVDMRLKLDVTDARSIELAIAAAGSIDVLISNAGVIFIAPIETTPGSSSATSTPKWATSLAIVSTNASSAHFVAAYAPRAGSVMRPRTLDTNSIRPLPRSRIAGSTAWATRSAPMVF